MDAIAKFSSAHGLSMTYSCDRCLDYALTLRQWRQNWMQNKDALFAKGCEARLHRMFEMYFAYCEAGFDAEYIHLYQITLQKHPFDATDEARTSDRTSDLFTQARSFWTLCLLNVSLRFCWRFISSWQVFWSPIDSICVWPLSLQLYSSLFSLLLERRRLISNSIEDLMSIEKSGGSRIPFIPFMPFLLRWLPWLTGSRLLHSQKY